MDKVEGFEEKIAPFTWVDHGKYVSVCLSENHGYLQEELNAAGFEGSGYDWDGLARVFLEERCPDCIDNIEFDSEAGMFCAYSKNTAALQEFICSFREACEDSALISDLLNRAEPD